MSQMSPLRRRMIEDITIRNLSPATQRSYIHAVKKFSAILADCRTGSAWRRCGLIRSSSRRAASPVFRRHGPAFRRDNAGRLSHGQLHVMGAIEACRTAALGGHVEACADCGLERIAYNSYRNRHCPKCQSLARALWRTDTQPAPPVELQSPLPLDGQSGGIWRLEWFNGSGTRCGTSELIQRNEVFGLRGPFQYPIRYLAAIGGTRRYFVTC